MASSSSMTHSTSARPALWQRRLQSELQMMMNAKIPEIQIDTEAMGNEISKWYVNVTGAEGTIYAGEKMRLQMKFTSNYPWSSPEVMFVGSHIPTHPHVYSNGHICMSLLGEDWTPAMTITGLCLSILSMLSSCKKKERPVNDDSYVRKYRDKSPLDAHWIYHDEAC